MVICLRAQEPCRVEIQARESLLLLHRHPLGLARIAKQILGLKFLYRSFKGRMRPKGCSLASYLYVLWTGDANS